MASTNLDDGTWTLDALKIRITSHPLFKQHGMEMPAKILEQDLKSAARLFDQHDSSSTIADGKTPRPLEYQSYTVNPDLRPMAAAAGLNNTHGKEFSKAVLAQWLQRWDVDHAPRMAMFLPRPKKNGTSVVPKVIVQTQNQTELKPADSKKRKIVSNMPFVPQKRHDMTRAMTKDDDVETLDGGNLDDDLSARSLRQRLIRRLEDNARRTQVLMNLEPAKQLLPRHTSTQTNIGGYECANWSPKTKTTIPQSVTQAVSVEKAMLKLFLVLDSRKDSLGDDVALD